VFSALRWQIKTQILLEKLNIKQSLSVVINIPSEEWNDQGKKAPTQTFQFTRRKKKKTLLPSATLAEPSL
jgi:hypothetical protein